MNNYPDHGHSSDESISDADLAAFQSELDTDASSDFDVKGYFEGLQNRLQDALNRAGYLPLDEDNARSRIFYDEFVDELYKKLADTDTEDLYQYIHDVADTNQKRAAMKERFVLKKIQIGVVSAEGSMVDGKNSDDEATQLKAKLYADLIVMDQLEPSDPLMTVLNEMVPGKMINPDDEILEQHYLRAFEGLANAQEKNAKVLAEMADAYNFLGIDVNDMSEDTMHLKSSIVQMILLIGRVGNGKVNAVADRQARLYSFSREHGVDPAMTDKIIQLVEKRYPLN